MLTLLFGVFVVLGILAVAVVSYRTPRVLK